MHDHRLDPSRIHAPLGTRARVYAIFLIMTLPSCRLLTFSADAAAWAT
jgi:hypothetical protein